MNVLINATTRFAITGDGELWSPNPSYSYRFWTRYLDVYDQVYLLVRAAPCAAPPEGWTEASGPGVEAWPLPCYQGPRGFVRNYVRIRRTIGEALAGVQAVQLRVSSVIGDHVQRAMPADRPYGVEVVGDPWEGFGPGGLQHPLRPFFRWWFTRHVKRVCAHACGAAYVTEYALQRRYPPAPDAFSTHYSSIMMSDAAFVSAPRLFQDPQHRRNLIVVATLAQLYKGHDVLIDAVGTCLREGLDVDLTIVGDGQHQPMLEAQAAALGLREHVHFLGRLHTGEAVRAQLDQADLFVMPSRSEGLPRALIEAMARGLPCVGSAVGGIPELLPAEDIVPPEDVAALANKIRDVLASPDRMAQMSARNLEKAKDYRETILRQRWIAFYRYVRERTQAWLETQ